ncbi:MAG: DUF721 domain-containing protein [Flavobacteriaceae bacterium]|nr:DUF721 domain-containing protein [Bacteroidia bacterium]NNF75806.1 DUF721 domain-containing protein [Flavobacteriaceae bacterium]NNK72670.1 DUF721 domain-containing protein [Flavobacteriaceae bacterium]
MSERKHDNMKLKDVIKAFVKSNKLQGGLDVVNVRHAWEELMGQGVNQYTTRIEFKGETLYVNLSSSVLREELSYGKEKIIHMMNEALGKQIIHKIVLR